MNIWQLLGLLLALLLSSCTSSSPQLAFRDSGFGGTGALPCTQTHAYAPGDSGFGSTGHSEQCGFGGTGVIGTITDFGSIWVNGLEIDLKPDTRIDSNLGHPVQLAIGHQIITHTAPDALETDHVQVFYPIAGRIEQREGDMIRVAGETVYLNQATRGLTQPQIGDYIAVNGWPRPDGSWLATRIDPNPQQMEKVDRLTLDALRTRRALLEGTVIHQDGKSLLAPYNLPLTAEEARQIENGTLALVMAQRFHQRWQIEQIRTLHQWRMDWRQLQMHQHDIREIRTLPGQPHERFERLHEQQETLYELNERKGEGSEAREYLESLREQREQAEDIRVYREYNESLSDQREIIEEIRERFQDDDD